MEEKLNKLAKLYEEMHLCLRCINSPNCKIVNDLKKVMRIVEKRTTASKVFLVGQALGEQTQRISGRPYTKANGKLSNTGHNLDKFLRLFGYTINSADCRSGCQYAYSSDIVQCYPGKKESGQGDRKPKTTEIINCINQGFLLKEIELAEPTLLLLMGKASRDSFYKHILQAEYPSSLSEHINEIVNTGLIQTFRNLFVIPIQHPSGANPQFYMMIKNRRLIELIKEVLQ